jgi:GNAT superfamily N-acetyltransferase
MYEQVKLGRTYKYKATVAFHNRRAVAIAIYLNKPDRPSTYMMFVSPNFRRLGIGRRLLKYVQRRIKALKVFVHDRQSFGFYTDIGAAPKHPPQAAFHYTAYLGI